MNTATLITTALFANDSTAKKHAQEDILRKAKNQGIYSASLFPLYEAIGKGTLEDSFTVPALNIRTLTFDTARMLFTLMKQYEIGPIIFEIARSELTYTNQTPGEYAFSVIAGALAADYSGPVFLQADHLQVNKLNFDHQPEQEITDLKHLISSYINAGFHNIDIDASTLVDYTLTTPRLQQEKNAQVTARLTSYIRTLPRKDFHFTIGGEIGHIGDRNSTVVDLRAFMEQYLTLLPNQQGISKISVQTGSTHGGIPLSDGKIKEILINTQVLKDIGKTARLEYFLGGVVQHGASTLPLHIFQALREAQTLEVHLATALQNITFDTLPSEIREQMYAWIKNECVVEKEWTEEQFLYKSRKKAFGPFKQQLFELSPQVKMHISSAQAAYLTPIFKNLKLFQTKKILETYYAF